VAAGEDLNPSSMLSYLANIEARTNEILHVYAGSLALLKGVEAHPGAAIMALGQGPSVPIHSGVMRIEPPSANDEVRAGCSHQGFLLYVVNE
jgi:hypothetical protein